MAGYVRIPKYNAARREKLLATTFRDFDGGLNYASSDLNMQPRFLREGKNMYRNLGGALAVRFGTRAFCDITQETAFPITEDDQFVADFANSTTTVLRIIRYGHGLATSDTIDFSGFTEDFFGIPYADLNATHTVTVLDSDRFTITLTAFTATSTGQELMEGGNYTLPSEALSGDILNMQYFANRIVVVTDDGEIGVVSGAGSLTVIWDSTIAAAQSDPAWSADATFVSFAEFGGELIVCNGVDKPLLIDSAFNVSYLQDLGTSSNSNTPTTRYVLAMNHYVIMAGDPVDPNMLYISAKDTSGTWEGDPAPNDGISIDMSKYAGTSEIRGISRFRDKLVVAFDDKLVIGTLGIYDGSDHVPTFDDSIDKHGTISHRAMLDLGDELLLTDNNGVPSIAQALFTGTMRPERASALVDPVLKGQLRALSDASLEDRVWSVYNKNEDQYMLFVPNDQTLATTTETVCWVYTSTARGKDKMWHRFTGWNFRAGVVSKQNRVFFADANIIYMYGNEDTAFYGDHINAAGGADGTAVSFEAEWPWMDLGERSKLKESRFVSLETTGTSSFTLQMFVDKIRYDENNADNPELEMAFVGGDSGGYGAGAQPYGGGRRTADERPWAWPSKFKIAKLRITGSSNEPLEIVSMTLLRLHGSIRR